MIRYGFQYGGGADMGDPDRAQEREDRGYGAKGSGGFSSSGGPKETGITDSEGNPVTFGQDNTQVGFSQSYIDNNPQVIKPTLENPNVSKTNALKSLYNNFIKNFGEEAFIDRYSNYTDNPEVARLASIKANVSPGDFFGGLMSLAKNPLGTGYGVASTGLATSFDPAALSGLGFMGTVAGLLGQGLSNNPIDLANPSNYEMAAPGAPMRYTGPVGHFNTAQISQLEKIQGGLTLDQQADIAISQFEREQVEKNARPGATVQPTEEFVNPVESKFTEEQLIAYNEYIERGYTPEIAEYLVMNT